MNFKEALGRLLGVTPCAGVVPREQGEAMGNEATDVIYCAINLAEAEVMRSKLRGAGIPVFLRGESAGSTVYPLTVGPLAQVEVLVPVEQAEQARTLLDIEPFSPEELDELALQGSSVTDLNGAEE